MWRCEHGGAVTRSQPCKSKTKKTKIINKFLFCFCIKKYACSKNCLLSLGFAWRVLCWGVCMWVSIGTGVYDFFEDAKFTSWKLGYFLIWQLSENRIAASQWIQAVHAPVLSYLCTHPDNLQRGSDWAVPAHHPVPGEDTLTWIFTTEGREEGHTGGWWWIVTVSDYHCTLLCVGLY